MGSASIAAMEHRSLEELEAGLDHVRQSPTSVGTLELIVRRPVVEEREVLEEAELDLSVGLVGDCWLTRGSSSTEDGSADADAQLTVMNSRSVALVAGSVDRWQLAGDQLFVDLDLSVGQLPAGSRVAIRDAIIEITAKPHRGCDKFAARFGKVALRFVNTGEGLVLNLRGRNARVVTPGTIRRGDTVRVSTRSGASAAPRC
jgi:hypothetical protein